MTTEDKLHAIIEARVKGGYDSEFWTNGMRVISQSLYDHADNRWHILEILLDPAGLRAAYGETGWNNCWQVGHKLLDAWLSSEGDAAKTIDQAYQLLP